MNPFCKPLSALHSEDARFDRVAIKDARRKATSLLDRRLCVLTTISLIHFPSPLAHGPFAFNVDRKTGNL